MTVRDLIEQLQAMNPDALVVTAEDGEGNDYNPVERVDKCVYVATSPWNGDIYMDATDIPPDSELWIDGWDMRKPGERGGVAAVCIWPVS